METINFNKATKIYYGLDNNCRCGCGGNYADNGERTFTRYKNAIIKLNQEPDDVCETYMNFSLPKNKAYTIYFD